MSKVILQNVQALAAGEEIRETEDGRPVTVPVVTVLVSPADAEKLALAANEGADPIGSPKHPGSGVGGDGG